MVLLVVDRNIETNIKHLINGINLENICHIKVLKYNVAQEVDKFGIKKSFFSSFNLFKKYLMEFNYFHNLF